jgi:hypothetical protein
MDRTALHLEIRNALSLSDELSRHEHARGDDALAGHLAALRSALGDLEREVGRDHDAELRPDPETVETVERAIEALFVRRANVPRALKSRLGTLLASAERVGIAISRPDERVPSKPVLGGLPLARVLPQDAHSVVDYLSAGAYLVSARLARTNAAKIAGMSLAVGVSGTSALTDYRLSVAKVIPIEIHECLDHASGLSAVLAPFVLGYAKKDPVATAIQVVTGLSVIVGSLFTDYRASKGVGAPKRSLGGPDVLREGEEESGRRVPDQQRPLEGLSSAPSDWQPEDGPLHSPLR